MAPMVNDTGVAVDHNSSICDRNWDIPVEDSLLNLKFPQTDVLEEVIKLVSYFSSPFLAFSLENPVLHGLHCIVLFLQSKSLC